jgi:nucleotide-binding universal stress UspA family protein
MNAPALPASRFQRLLFCTDFSASADAAFGFALDAAIRRPDATLYVLHVLHEPGAQFWTSYLAGVENSVAAARQVTDAKMADRYLARAPQGLDVRVELRVGPEAATILEFARTLQIDVIILGRHGHGGAGKTLFGSVVEKVVRKAKCAVLVVPLNYAQAAPDSAAPPPP